MEERLRFVARLLDGEAMTDGCRGYGGGRHAGRAHVHINRGRFVPQFALVLRGAKVKRAFGDVKAAASLPKCARPSGGQHKAPVPIDENAQPAATGLARAKAQTVMIS